MGKGLTRGDGVMTMECTYFYLSWCLAVDRLNARADVKQCAPLERVQEHPFFLKAGALQKVLSQ